MRIENVGDSLSFVPPTTRFIEAHMVALTTPRPGLPSLAAIQKGTLESTYLAMGFADVRAGTWYPPEH